MLGHIFTKNRVICDNNKFNQKDFWDSDDIWFQQNN